MVRVRTRERPAPTLVPSTALVPPQVLCIGSAHLDILCSVTGDAGALDRIGRTTVEVGGTACNIAINLARLGADVTLLTTLDDGALADVVRRHVADAGVTLRVRAIPGGERSVAAFCAHLDAAGELLSAVSSMPVEGARFGTDLLRGRWDAVVLEANLHPRELERLAERFARVPVFLGAVSQEKSLRLSGAVRFARGMFINALEFAYLHEKTRLTAEYLAAGGCVVYRTRGADGADVVTPDGVETVPAARAARAGNRLGAGDALAASVIYHLLLGAPPVEAARASMSFALEVAESALCNSATSGNPLERAITDFRRQAFVDVLTGLPNRSAGLRRVGEIELESKRVLATKGSKTRPWCAVAIVDIDHFKSVNDTFGHDAGDEALRLVAKAIGAALRKGDDGFRWGGEEFLCFISAKDAGEARAAAERVRQHIAAIEWPQRKLTASVGVALWPLAGRFDDVLAEADRALYEAKESGRNQVVVAVAAATNATLVAAAGD